MKVEITHDHAGRSFHLYTSMGVAEAFQSRTGHELAERVLEGMAKAVVDHVMSTLAPALDEAIQKAAAQALETAPPESAALQWTEHRPSVHKGRGGDRDYFVKPISPERWEAVFYVFYDGLGRARQEVAPGADFRSLHEAMQACEQHHQERQP